jgi:copper transport protein
MWSTRKLDSESRTRLTSVLIPHFTILAMTSVGVLTITGVYAALLHIGTLKELLNTDYGRALIVKFLIAAPMLGMGGIHFLITTPVMRRAAKRPGGSLTAVARFQALLTAEATLGMVLLIWVAVFTTLPPARIPVKAAGINQTMKINDLTVALNIFPGRAGMNTFKATVSSGGHPVTDAQSVSLEFRSLSGMVMASQTTLDNMGGGMYSIQGGYLGMPEKWDIKVVVVRQGKYDAYADYKVDTNPTVASSKTLPWRSIAIVLLVATAICGVFSFLAMGRRSPAEEWRWI